MYARLTGLITALAFTATASAADLGAATFSDMHVRPSNANVAIGFFTITTPTDDAILSMTADCCKAAELHRTERINGAMSMRRISEQPLKKGKALKVQPDADGGEHLMLVGLNAPLAEGDKVSITFTLKKAGEQTVSFPVYADQDSAAHAH